MIPSSELIINPDGSVFHLHLCPHQLADQVILCGDPGRVSTVAAHFDQREHEVESREFHTITGTFKGKRISVVSTGIGCDNIDIVLNELDALKNIDFQTREVRKTLTSLDIVRIGTCGGLQPDTPVGTFVCSKKSIGFDGLLNYYRGRNEVCDLALEEAFKKHMEWSRQHCSPYVVDNSSELLQRVFHPEKGMVEGLTISCGGFYGPQGRQLRLGLADPHQNEKVMSFDYNGLRVTNYEMESSAVAGLSRLLGHRAMTVCMVVANRVAKESDVNYKNSIDTLIEHVLECL